MQEPINSRDLFISIFLISPCESDPWRHKHARSHSKLRTTQQACHHGHYKRPGNGKMQATNKEECCLPMDPADSYHIAQFPRCISTFLPIGSSS